MANRNDVYEAIDLEREYQDKKWGKEFDDKNTPNDWVAYIARYLGKAVIFPWSKDAFQTAILKIAALCVAILERDNFPQRHYDIEQQGDK